MTMDLLAQILSAEPDSAYPRNVQIDGVSAIAVLIIISFAVERFATSVMFCFSLSEKFREACPEPLACLTPEDKQRTGARVYRGMHFCFSVLGAVTLVWMGKIGILDTLGFKQVEAHHGFDATVTVLLLTAGADQLAKMLSFSNSGGNNEPKAPLEVSGTLSLEGGQLAETVSAADTESTDGN